MAGWPNNTRLFYTDLGSKAKPTGGGLVTYDLPRVGILQALQIALTGTVAGSLSAQNALGMASILNRIRLTANSGLDLINLSGPGYFYLLRDMLETLQNPNPASNARDAVTATTFNLGMYIPLVINSRDPLGLIMLQNEQTQLRLELDFLADASVATGATVTATVHPQLECFTVPIDAKDWPAFDYAVTITEESQTISGAGEVTYNWPRANNYLQVIHGCGIAASPADNFTAAKLRVSQSQYLIPNGTPAFWDLLFARYRGATREAGIIPIDLISLSGLGNYGSMRDAIDTSQLTDIATVITASGAGTLYTVKRQLVPLNR